MRPLDLSDVQLEIRFLSNHLLIANFIGPKPKFGFFNPWVEILNHEVKQGHATFNHEVDLKYDTLDTTKQM